MNKKNKLKRLLIPFLYLHHFIFKKVPYKAPLKFSEYFKLNPQFVPLNCQRECSKGFKKVAVLPEGRVFGQDGFIISPDNNILEPSRTFNYAKVKANPFLQMRSLPKEIYLDGNVATFGDYFVESYYHWFFDILPRLTCFLNCAVDFDYFIFSKFNGQFQKDTLKALGIPMEKIKFVDNEVTYRAKNLYCYGLSMPCSNVSQCQVELHKSLTRPQNPPPYEKIYISRQKATKRKILNEAEILPILEKYGYKTIFFEDLSLQEQIDATYNAKYAIAPHGAGLTNLIFAKDFKGIVEIFEKSNVNTCFQEASAVRNYKHIRLKAKSCKKSIIIDPKALEKEVSLLEASLLTP